MRTNTFSRFLNFVIAAVTDALGADGHHDDTAILGDLIARHLDARRPRCLEGTSKIGLPKRTLAARHRSRSSMHRRRGQAQR